MGFDIMVKDVRMQLTALNGSEIVLLKIPCGKIIKQKVKAFNRKKDKWNK